MVEPDRLVFEVIAEGIERPDQFPFLAGLYFDLVQGFLFHRPIPARDFRIEIQIEA